MRVCVYTAIYGGYDSIKPPPAQSVSTDFVCYTDRIPQVPRGLWRMVRDRRLARLHPRLRAKWFKTHPHELFAQGRPTFRNNLRLALARPLTRYHAVIWIDASIAIKSTHFARDMLANLGAHGMAMFRHPDRDCVFDEAAESIKWAKYAGLPIMAQVEAYRAEGYPAHRGLMAGGVLVYRTNWPSLARVCEAWWEENLHWTCQDQLSLPVVQWRLGIGNGWIDGHLWFNPWYDHIPHQLEEGPLAG